MAISWILHCVGDVAVACLKAPLRHGIMIYLISSNRIRFIIYIRTDVLCHMSVDLNDIGWGARGAAVG
jgi:hypothetical protein